MVDQVRVFGERANERMLVHELEAGLLGFVPFEQSADHAQPIGAVAMSDAAGAVDLIAGMAPAL